jgi:adenine-specific DNA-methyltransferase
MNLIEYAQQAGRTFVAGLTREEQREAGQFMTPAPIARFMAERLVAGLDRRAVSVLEPSAGAGVLAAAVIEALLAIPGRPVEYIELLLVEQDYRLLPALNELASRATELCQQQGVELVVRVECRDFLLSELAVTGQPIDGLLVIANPPFLKLNKNDPRALAHGYAVWGQPNIYSLFMAACARLVPPGGRWCFITPRSWMAGAYFKAARQSMLRSLTLDSIHAFDSRRESFEEDAVLQETVITWATGRGEADVGVNLMLTRSQGTSDLGQAEVQALPMARVLSTDGDSMLSLPAHGHDPFEGWTATLATYGLKVSTGPVVAFRATAFIREQAEQGTVPLLWLQHVGQQRIDWPIKKKREHIRATAESAWMLVPNTPMVLMRRFSPKEDERRVTCAAYGCGLDRLPGDVIGLENHLNFIYRPGGTMSPYEARGLSAFLASRLVDAHFRALAGSTQVNATELRQLPLPPLATLEAIGAALSARPTLAECDRAVEAALGVAAARRRRSADGLLQCVQRLRGWLGGRLCIVTVSTS